MKHRIRQHLNSDNISLAGNTVSLAMIKGADMVTQLLVMPRIISKLGIEAYGQIALFVVIMQYITFICDFGYNFNATKRISENKIIFNINTVFSAVSSAKVLIMMALLLVLFIASLVFPDTLPHKVTCYLLLFVVFSAFTLDWLYLGLQKMLVPAIIKITYRIFYVAYIYLFITEYSSYTVVVVLDALCPVVLTTLSLLYAFIFLKLRFVRFERVYSIELFKESWVLFSSSVFITFYRNINVLILKLLAGEFYAGVYAAVEKIVRAFQAIIEPITTALFPYVGKKFALFHTNNERTGFIDKLLSLYIPVMAFMALIIWLFTPQILQFMNVDAPYASLNLHIMTLAFFSGCLNYLLGYVGLVNLGKNKDFRHCVTIVGSISLLVAPLLIYLLRDVGAAALIAFSESLLLILVYNKYRQVKYAC